MDERLNWSRLVRVLRTGEEPAARVALEQSRLAPQPWMRRALETQARHERGHALVAAVLDGRSDTPVPRRPARVGPEGRKPGGFKGTAQPIRSRAQFFANYAELLADAPEHRRLIRMQRAPLSFLDYDWGLNDVSR